MDIFEYYKFLDGSKFRQISKYATFQWNSGKSKQRVLNLFWTLRICFNIWVMTCSDFQTCAQNDTSIQLSEKKNPNKDWPLSFSFNHVRFLKNVNLPNLQQDFKRFTFCSNHPPQKRKLHTTTKFETKSIAECAKF